MKKTIFAVIILLCAVALFSSCSKSSTNISDYPELIKGRWTVIKDVYQDSGETYSTTVFSEDNQGFFRFTATGEYFFWDSAKNDTASDYGTYTIDGKSIYISGSEYGSLTIKTLTSSKCTIVITHPIHDNLSCIRYMTKDRDELFFVYNGKRYDY